MLSVVYTNDGWSPSLGTQDMTTLAFMGSQELPWPGKRRLRGDVAVLEADAVEQQLERVRLGVAADVKRAYYGLVLSRELLELVREQEQLWKQIEGVARARYAVGQGAQPDVLRVQIEVTRVEQLRTEQEAEGRDPRGGAQPPDWAARPRARWRRERVSRFTRSPRTPGARGRAARRASARSSTQRGRRPAAGLAPGGARAARSSSPTSACRRAT